MLRVPLHGRLSADGGHAHRTDMDLESSTGDPSNVNTDRLLNPKNSTPNTQGHEGIPIFFVGEGMAIKA